MEGDKRIEVRRFAGNVRQTNSVVSTEAPQKGQGCQLQGVEIRHG